MGADVPLPRLPALTAWRPANEGCVCHWSGAWVAGVVRPEGPQWRWTVYAYDDNSRGRILGSLTQLSMQDAQAEADRFLTEYRRLGNAEVLQVTTVEPTGERWADNDGQFRKRSHIS